MSPLISRIVVMKTILQIINLVAKVASTSTEAGMGGCFICVKLKPKGFDYINI